MNRSTIQFSLLAAAALCAAALLFLALTGDWHWTAPSAQLPREDSLRAEALVLTRATPESLQQMVERPLLQPDRRPPAVEKAAAEPDPMANLQLLGVFGSGAAGGVVLKTGDRVSRLRLGERTGPWTLQAVHAAQADFVASDGRRHSLLLPRQPQPGAMPEIAPASPAPLTTVSPAADAAPISPEMAERARLRAERAAAIAERMRNKPPVQTGQ